MPEQMSPTWFTLTGGPAGAAGCHRAVRASATGDGLTFGVVDREATPATATVTAPPCTRRRRPRRSSSIKSQRIVDGATPKRRARSVTRAPPSRVISSRIRRRRVSRNSLSTDQLPSMWAAFHAEARMNSAGSDRLRGGSHRRALPRPASSACAEATKFASDIRLNWGQVDQPHQGPRGDEPGRHTRRHRDNAGGRGKMSATQSRLWRRFWPRRSEGGLSQGSRPGPL